MTTENERRPLTTRAKVAAVAGVLASLALLGYATKPQWQPWWFAETVCGGHLSAADLDAILPAERLQPDEEVSGPDEVSCGLNTEDDHFVLNVHASTDPDDVREELESHFRIPFTDSLPFPRGIPGFEVDGQLVVLQECPDLPRDGQGRKRRMLTRAMGSWPDRPTGAALRTAVAMANASSAELGCGAERLPMPEKPAPADPAGVPPRQAKGALCGWLADAPALPGNRYGRPWKAAALTGRTAPITSCRLTSDGEKPVTVEFGGWYGDWTDEPFHTLTVSGVDLPDGGPRSTDPVMSERLGRATARCSGESANYRVYASPSDPKQHLPAQRLRELLVAFAEDQAERHGCTDLELPGKTIHPER
ncbi:hypothetical protein [Streptomyces sp. bgisy100]|uniref:hypothetical protein n=1 Tax=Streptomyces sp. bgisy100 TaxID=3413783 RepID=UPI003D71FED8